MGNNYLGPNERQGWLKPNLVKVYEDLLCNISGGHDCGEEYENSRNCEYIQYIRECTHCNYAEERREYTGESHDYSIKVYTANEDAPDCSEVSRWYNLKCSKCGETEGHYYEGGLGYHVYEQGPNDGLWKCIYCGELSPGATAICDSCGRDFDPEATECPYCGTPS